MHTPRSNAGRATPRGLDEHDTLSVGSRLVHPFGGTASGATQLSSQACKGSSSRVRACMPVSHTTQRGGCPPTELSLQASQALPANQRVRLGSERPQSNATVAESCSFRNGAAELLARCRLCGAVVIFLHM